MTAASVLRAALASAGHEYLTSAEQQQMVDQAAQELMLCELWPWRKVTERLTPASGVVTPTLLGPVDAVFRSDDFSELLPVEDLATLRRLYGDPAQGGRARYFVPASPTQLQLFPVETVAVDVVHFVIAAWTTGNTVSASAADTVRWPVDFDSACVLKARQLAYEETDELMEASNMERRFTNRVEELRQTFIRDRVVGKGYVQTTAELI